MLQGGREQRLSRYEHHDNVRSRLEVRPVALVAKPVDVILHLARVVSQFGVARGVFLTLHRVEVCRQRHLRIDDDVLPAGEFDDDVRRQASVFGPDGLFHVEVSAFEQTRAFEHAAQLDLSPLPARIR